LKATLKEHPMTAIRALHAIPLSTFAAEVRAGLKHHAQKELPSKYLYDTTGTALFEAITTLPEYGLTRAEERIVRAHSDELVALLPRVAVVAELGSGSGRKTRVILKAMGTRKPTTYHPIEISPAALTQCRRELSDLDSVAVVGCEREYFDGLALVTRGRQRGEPILILFLGSTIGNFRRLAATRFLRDIRQMLEPGDALLLGTDLEKPVPQLLAAYDDPLGVTAAFNLNLLARINRELGGDFALPGFEHVARFNAQARAVEMHLRSRCPQQVNVPKAGLKVRLTEGETIWTESCHKYAPDEVPRMAGDAGFRCEVQWFDSEWPFADSLLIAA
jgi:dimethylhistidine N-methyltransferase